MKPVAIFRHAPSEGPGYFATYLNAKHIPWRLVGAAGGAVPADPGAFAGLAFMGGPMSVNDDLPWIEPVLELIRKAVEAGVPCLGHCLGGQLISKAFGGTFPQPGQGDRVGISRPSPVRAPNGGWATCKRSRRSTGTARRSGFRPAPRACSRARTAPTSRRPRQAPRDAVPRRDDARNMNAAVVAGDVSDWVTPHAGPSVQTAAEATERLDERVQALNAVAAQLYDRWVAGLVP